MFAWHVLCRRRVCFNVRSRKPRALSVFYAAEQEYASDLPLPLLQYLKYAWATEGLVGVVPWVADFLRMMKWDAVSMQVSDIPSAPQAVVIAQCFVGVMCYSETRESFRSPCFGTPQADTYRSVLVTLAQLHAQPRMRPGHPRFTQGLLAVSCEVGSDR